MNSPQIHNNSLLSKIYHLQKIWIIEINYIKPKDPAVKPIIRKNENSAKSLGNELTISFN